MSVKHLPFGVVCMSVALTVASVGPLESQAPQSPPAQAKPSPGAPPPPAEPAQPHEGGFVPGQKRAPEDPAQVARGKTLFEINCRGCHGHDLRGGDLGGPNLLRSQAALSDLHGELIVPIIQGSRQKQGMPNIGLRTPDAQAVAAYVRSVIETIGGQGKPPSAGEQVVSILVGNAAEGKSYFDAKCSSCHSATGDLGGLASKITDQRKLQDAWIVGGQSDEARRTAPGDPPGRSTVTASVATPSGEVNGQLVKIDDFLVTLQLADGTQQSFARNGDSPEVVVHDPLKAHQEMLTQLTDKDMHDVTAYLVTLK